MDGKKRFSLKFYLSQASDEDIEGDVDEEVTVGEEDPLASSLYFPTFLQTLIKKLLLFLL